MIEGADIAIATGSVTIPPALVLWFARHYLLRREKKDDEVTGKLTNAHQELFTLKLQALEKMAEHREGELKTKLENTITMLGNMEKEMKELRQSIAEAKLTQAGMSEKISFLQSDVLPAIKTAIGQMSMYYKGEGKK